MVWDDNYIREAERTYGERTQAAGFHLLTRVREALSKPGTRKAASGYVGAGRHYTPVVEGPLQQGAAGIEGLKTYVNAFGVGGKKYRKGRTIYGAERSKPGEPPRKQRGTLRQSTAQDFNAETITARVGTPLRYGKALELGTRKMGPRPFLRSTLAAERQTIIDMITGKPAT